jgi:Carboxypeptidase regulatory-like domain
MKPSRSSSGSPNCAAVFRQPRFIESKFERESLRLTGMMCTKNGTSSLKKIQKRSLNAGHQGITKEQPMGYVEKVRIGGYVRCVLRLVAAVVLLASWNLPVDAQVTTATLYGVVEDPSSAVLPGASVTATNQGTGLARSVVTDERGEFAVSALPAGTYTVKIEMPGFKTYTNPSVQLGSGQNIRQRFVLEVGQLSENITVAETVPLVRRRLQRNYARLEQ